MHERAKNIILLPLRHADELRVILAVQRDLGALLDVEPVVVAFSMALRWSTVLPSSSS